MRQEERMGLILEELAADGSVGVAQIAAKLGVSTASLRPDIKLIVTGGAARSESYELVGPLAEATLDGMNLDLAVVGVDGITVAGGLTTHHDIEAHTNRVLIGRARH